MTYNVSGRTLNVTLSTFVITHTLQTYKNGADFVAHPVYSKRYRISQYYNTLC